jgi:hypothetical protein
MELTYIGEDYPQLAPGYVRPFQEKATGKQYDWADLPGLIESQDDLRFRKPTELELAALDQNTTLIGACLAFLLQFADNEYAHAADPQEGA